MNIQILHRIEGAKAAKGLTVIIDVFRAFSMEAYMMAQGAANIIPIGDKNLAYQLKEENPNYILAGERDGKTLPGFDVGNSPWELLKMDVRGKTIVHTTSAGTQGLVNATHADEILGGSLVTARALAKYIENSGSKDVSLVCMGWNAKEETEEDTLCARYIESLLCGKQLDMEAEIAHVKATSGAKFFDKTQNDVFPMEDFALCTQWDKFDFVLKLEKGADGFSYMTKVGE